MNIGTTTPRGPLRAEALQAMREAVWKVIQEYKRFGISLTIMREGKVVQITPEEAEVEYLAEQAKANAGVVATL